MKYYITGGKGQKQPPGPDHVGLTGRQGVGVIEGHAGHMTDRGDVGQSDNFLRMVNISTVLGRAGGGQASSILKHNRQTPLIKHPT